MHECRNIFMTEDEIIVDMLLYRLAEDDKLKIRQILPTEVKDLCADWSKPLIQHYRLDDENNPNCVADAMHENYPVKMSYRIVAKVWSRLTGKSLPSYTPAPSPDLWF